MGRRTEVLTSSYPAGVRALLPDEVRRRRRVESAIVAELEARSFDEIVVPIIDFVDPYGGADRESQRRSYRFVDRDGELIAVRSDFTPMVARALAPAIARTPLPLRVFYRGDVVRCEASKLGAQRELFQIGAELLGDDSPAADLAMLTLAIELVTKAGVAPTIVLTDASIARQLIDSSTDSPAARIALRSALAQKRMASLEGFDDELAPERFELLRKLTAGRATLEDFMALPVTRDAANALRVLQQRVCETIGANVVLALDDIDEEPGYYTGIRFQLFEPRTRLRLAQGGRYDDLYARFGAKTSAIGFTLTVDYFDGGAR